jgi:pyroglutamyl-peptidase
MAPAPILLTGFEAYGGFAVNPTALLMEAMAGDEGVATAVLPVEYDVCALRFAELIEAHAPSAVLAFGMAARSDFLVVERIAWNRDESLSPDNAGTVREDQAIVEDGPTAYGCGVPVPFLLRALAQAGLPVTFGDHAGGFICNHLFYRARHHIETAGLDLPMAFLHVPPLPEQVEEQKGRHGMPLERMIVAARATVAFLRGGVV